MNAIKNTLLVFTLLITICAMASSIHGETAPYQIEQHKECPLCGMFPARYIEFQCQVIFEDGSYEAFDSPAGLLVYLLFPDKTGIPHQLPLKVYFRDFTSREWIDSASTHFVVGTEVMGPMGIDFFPVSGKKQAEIVKTMEQGALVISNDRVDRQFMIKAANSNWLHFLARKIVLE